MNTRDDANNRKDGRNMKSEELAWKIRRHGIEMTHLSGGSHIGAVLSVADIIAVLYADVLKYNPEEPDWPGRDRMILRNWCSTPCDTSSPSCWIMPDP